MINYFKNNQLIMSSSDGISPSDFDFIKENLANEQLELISQWYIFSDDWELVQPEWRQEAQDEKQTQSKKSEAQQVILTRYPLRKQINLNRLWWAKTDDMNTRIDAIRKEENKNGKDADFSAFI